MVEPIQTKVKKLWTHRKERKYECITIYKKLKYISTEVIFTKFLLHTVQILTLLKSLCAQAQQKTCPQPTIAHGCQRNPGQFGHFFTCAKGTRVLAHSLQRPCCTLPSRRNRGLRCASSEPFENESI